jgi:transcriptional regulator with XRE-family HTH domain
VYKIACIGNRIRERRLKLNLTLENLAEKTDLTQNFIGNIERGNDNPSLETLIKIANALAVNTDYLCQDCIENAEAQEYDYHIKEVVNKMTDMSVKQKELIMQSIEALIHFSDSN